MFRFLILVLLINLNLAHAEFLRVTKGYQFSFPKDHGAHYDYPAEWWYFTGHLEDNSKRTFGFELTFFRIGVNRGEKKSLYTANNLYISHFAITDDKNKKFYHKSKFERELGKRTFAKNNKLYVKINSWKAEMNGKTIKLVANSKNFSLALELKNTKPVILNGDNGYSQKGNEEHEASYYMTLSDLKGSGEIKVENKYYKVKASAWMDHEVLSFKANDKKKTWDWFAIKLDNNEELMFFYLKEEGKISKFSSGTYIKQNGEIEKLKFEDFKIEYLDFFKSEKTNKKYPVAFNVKIPKLSIDLNISATVKDQELNSSYTRSYWEGRCLVSAIVKDKKIGGKAYVEIVK